MDLHEAIRVRRSVRSYSSNPIPPDVLDRLRTAIRSAPSACNYQPWHFVLVTDQPLRRQVADAAHGQIWMADAPLIVAGIGFPERAAKAMAGHRNSVEVDLAIAMEHLALAAASEGLGTCWIGAFDEPRIKLLLNIPKSAEVVAMMPVGYPSSPELIFPVVDGSRRPPEEIFSSDRCHL